MPTHNTNPKNSTIKLDVTQIILALIGVLGTITVAYFAYLQSAKPTDAELIIKATQTAAFEGTRIASATQTNTVVTTDTPLSVTSAPLVTTIITSTMVFTDDFEENLGGWLIQSGVLVAPGHNNSKSAVQIKYIGDNSNIARYIPGTFSLGMSYRASIWCKGEKNAECLLFFGEDSDDDGKSNDSGKKEAQALLPGNGEWQQLSLCRTLIKDKKMMVYLYARNSNSQATYDDLQVEQVSHC